MSDREDRGTKAYQQALAYVKDGNPGLSDRCARRMAARYLRVTASPPLSRPERRAARRERTRVKREAQATDD